jgi:DNA invertase Pin-like site-specific DNA recombinase
MLGVFAEFERSMIQERVRAGLVRAWAKGKPLGRPRIDADIEAKVRELADGGMGTSRNARTLRVGVSVSQRVFAELRPFCTDRAYGASSSLRGSETSGFRQQWQ